MAKAAGTAITSMIAVAATEMTMLLQRKQRVVRAAEDIACSSPASAEEEHGRRLDRLRLRLEAGEHHPEDREEHQQRREPRHDRGDRVQAFVARFHTSSRFATVLIRNVATMLARMIAITPAADAEPTLNASNAR